MGFRGAKGLLGLVALALLATGCSAGEQKRAAAAIEVDRPVTLVDEAVRIRITGLNAGERVTVTAEADDRAGTWKGEARFTADRRGVVDLTRAKPLSGTYAGADGMGLFWSMKAPPGGESRRSFEQLFPEQERDFTVLLSATGDDRPAARREITRVRMAEGVGSRALLLKQDKVAGRLYQPPQGTPKRAPVLIFGGSEGGGDYTRPEAALLASRGHPTLSLCYFGCDGLPKELANIPLEYFAEGARLVARQPGAKPGGVVAIGASRGTEPAQLLAQYYPDVVRDAVVFAPTDRIVTGFPDMSKPAWLRGGKPFPEGFPIPYDQVRGTVLAIAGGKDTLWDTRKSSESIAARRGIAEPHRALIHPGAGHALNSYPYTPRSTFSWAADLQDFISMGGSRPADAKARAQAWPEVLRVLTR
ncbi:acyl-CoA thioesterase/bile acid-CoA:amino acid N-acyltransferase family protein [Streptomyces sp. NPDC001889]